MITGVDLSFRGKVGFCKMDLSGVIIRAEGVCFSENDKSPEPEVLHKFGDYLEDTIFGSTIVAYEHVGFHYGTKAAQLYGMMEGCLLIMAYELKIPVFPIPTATLKKAATGDGKADKSGVLKAANRMWGLKLAKKDHDIADAIWAAEVGRRRHHGGSTVQKLIREED